MWITIGSTAIKHWFPDFPREPRDYDYVGRLPMMPVGGIQRKDYHPIEPLYKFLNDTDEFLDADSLFTLKVSHLNYDFKWEKSFNDCIFLSNKGCKINYELLEELQSFWEKQDTHSDKQLYKAFAYDDYPLDSKEALTLLNGVTIHYIEDKSKISGRNFMRGLKYYTRHVETNGQIFIIQNYKQILNQYKSKSK